jgi:phosphatidylglycerophosphate synthase
VGAALAWLAERLGLGPHAVSILSLVVGCGGVLVVATGGMDRLAGGCVLFTALFGAYWLDCADGVLARVTGRTSSFGAIFDKVIDVLVALCAVAALGVAALGEPGPLISPRWQPAVLVFSLLPRTAFSVFNWLKDSHLHKLDHSRAIGPSHSWLASVKRLIGNLIDDVPWRLGLCLSWACGVFWEFSLAFNLVLSVVFFGYMITSKRELDREDARSCPR